MTAAAEYPPVAVGDLSGVVYSAGKVFDGVVDISGEGDAVKAYLS